MSAEALTFQETPSLREAMEQGALTPAQCWAIEWEMLARPHLPWTPEAWSAHQRLTLHLWETEQMPVQ